VIPGKTIPHQWNRPSVWAVARTSPTLGSFVSVRPPPNATRERPRNDNVVSRMTALAASTVAATATVLMTLGRTCRLMIRRSLAPIAWAAWTYSCSRMTSVALRTTRATVIHKTALNRSPTSARVSV
jgi:hypothetical protein